MASSGSDNASTSSESSAAKSDAANQSLDQALDQAIASVDAIMQATAPLDEPEKQDHADNKAEAQSIASNDDKDQQGQTFAEAPEPLEGASPIVAKNTEKPKKRRRGWWSLGR